MKTTTNREDTMAPKINTDKYGRLAPKTSGVWERIARKHYQHISGIGVIYRPNTWDWEVVGGADDGHRYSTLTIAQHSAVKHFA